MHYDLQDELCYIGLDAYANPIIISINKIT